MSREDVIASLMEPRNADLCRSTLGINVAADLTTSALVDSIRDAAREDAATWTARTPLPLIELVASPIDSTDAESARAYDLNALHDALLKCGRVILEGPAGRGKTTSLAQLAELHLASGAVAFVVDLPAWVSSGAPVLEFIAQSPKFQAHGLDAQSLARAQSAVHFSFLLNGWNEVALSDSRRAAEQLRTLDRQFISAGIIVATRTHHVRPPIEGAQRIALLRITRRQRNDYLRGRLGNRAAALAMQLDADRELDDLARTPFVLSGVTTIFSAGATIPKTKMAVLIEVTRLMEDAVEHAVHLSSPPLEGFHRLYLEALAIDMTARGAVYVDNDHARALMHSVAQSLHDAHQITTLPSPADVLATLCYHHALERIEYPSLAFRFSHQQFQELYAAIDIKNRLLNLAARHDAAERSEFTASYVNAPAWTEPLRMIAQTIGTQVDAATADQREVQAGCALIEMAATVDLVFASELAGMCGPLAWSAVGPVLGHRLRSWHAVTNESHRNCALAAMLATGSDDFRDILLPLLSSADQQIRLRAYRLWPDINLKSLGANWRGELASWPDEVRADFVGEMLFHRFDIELATFAADDASPKVKQAAASGLSWRGSDDALTHVLESMDRQTFDAAARGSAGERFPEALRPRVIDSLRRVYDASVDPAGRLSALMHMAGLDEPDLDGRIRRGLTRCRRRSGTTSRTLSGRYSTSSDRPIPSG